MLQRSQFLPDRFFLFLPAAVTVENIATEFQEIRINKIPSNSIGHMNILPSIVIKIS